MYSDFIQIKSMQGELKLSHKLRNLGMTVSTEELIIQKPHINYHIPLEAIISILPYNSMLNDYSYVNRQDDREEVTRHHHAGLSYFKIHAKQSVMHNRSGIFPLESMDFVLPIYSDMLDAIRRFSALDVIHT